MSDSLVSIIVPCYKQAEYLEESLQSVLSQRYSNWECIIVDDGSPDNTEELALSYCKKDSRFVYVYKENGGLSSARNLGIRSANGVYILPLDADDKISPTYLSDAVRLLNEDHTVKLVYSKAAYFGAMEGEWRTKPYSFQALLRFNMIFCSAVFRKADFDNTNGYNLNMKKGLEDWDFWLSLLKPEDKVVQLPQIHFFYRIKEKSMLKSITEDQYDELFVQVFENHRQLYLRYMNPIKTLRERDYYKKKYRKIKKRYAFFECLLHPNRLFKPDGKE